MPTEELIKKLHTAVKQLNRRKVIECLNEKADVNAIVEGNTALYILLDTVSRNFSDLHLDILTDLLSAGADIHIENKKKITPLKLAFINKISVAIDQMLPLHVAVRENDYDKVISCIASGAHNVNELNQDGETVLHVIAKKSTLDETELAILKALLAAGANVNKHSGNGTPLECAIQKGNLDALQLMLPHVSKNDLVLDAHIGHTEPDYKPFPWYTNLVVEACRTKKANSVKILEMLKAHGALFDHPDELSNTPLRVCCLYLGRKHTKEAFARLKFLSENGGVTDSTLQITPLHLIFSDSDCYFYFDKEPEAESFYSEILDFFLSYGVNINEPSASSGKTILHFAANCNLLKAAEVFIRKGANVDALDNDQESPIFKAIENKNPKMVLLLKSIVDIEIKNKDGFTPFMYAMKLQQKAREEMKKNKNLSSGYTTSSYGNFYTSSYKKEPEPLQVIIDMLDPLDGIAASLSKKT